jgi:hypothetical protein
MLQNVLWTSFTNGANKLEWLYLAGLMFGVRQGPIRVKRLLGSSLLGGLQALPTNICLGWISLPGTNTLAYYVY